MAENKVLTEKDLQLLGQQYEEADHSCGGVSLNEYLLTAQNAKTLAKIREVVEGAEPPTRMLHISRSLQNCWLTGKEDMKQAILKALEGD